MVIVSKFGGSIMSSADRIRQAVEILRSDTSRRYVIASAPAGSPGEAGITDLLMMCHSAFVRHEDYSGPLSAVSEHFRLLSDELGARFDIDSEISALKGDLLSGKNSDYIASRGEFIMGKIIANILGWEFVDASSIVFFNNDGTLNESKTFTESKAKLSRLERAVIPSFYGSLPDGQTKTFPRGDGDSTGAIVARAVNADMFEKWSETVKAYSTDTSVIPNPKIIRNMTYSEASELNYCGIFTVNDGVLFMLKEAGIPIRIRSLNDSDDGGMTISANLPEGAKRNSAVCIAGRRNFYIIHIEKYSLNKQHGFGEKLFGIFSKYKVPCEHCLSGIHKISVVVKSQMFILHYKQIIDEINQTIEPDSVAVEKDLSLITAIGEGMREEAGRFQRIFSPLSRAGINVRMIDHGADGLNIIIGVQDKDYVSAVKILYDDVIGAEYSNS
ncbi:MAG: hypothetical protein IJP85_05190 [Synergistaceae bacterium]|nr:hypothetical protein [Synergistaceae bacterium]